MNCLIFFLLCYYNANLRKMQHGLRVCSWFCIYVCILYNPQSRLILPKQMG